MKKTNFLLGLLLLTALPLFAERVDPETARKVATTFLSNNGAKTSQLADLSKSVGFPNLYIFTTEEGFVVMSAEDCAKPILGYSLTEKFNVEGMPENISSWLQGYSDEIQYAIDNQIRASIETELLWKDLIEGKPNVAKTTEIVAPLIQTKWNQKAPYNNLCPSDNDKKAVTGCVATAMAQIMKYWNYPTRGIGSHDYQYGVFGSISADFGATNYDWTHMTNTYSNTSTLEQQTAVATLMYHCGVSVEMKYGFSESGSNSTRASIGMRTYFNYNTSYIEKNNYDEQTWSDTLKYELNNHRPMLYSGSGSKGGHAFICDGYNSDDFFHFNWGWSGTNDDYFSLSALTPGSYNFSSNQAAVISIYPLSNSTTPLALENNQATLTWTDSQGCDSYNIYKNNTLIASTTETTYTDPEPSYGSNKYYVRGVAGATLTLPSNYVFLNIDFPTPIANDLHAILSVNNLSLSWETPDWCLPSFPDETSFSYVDEKRQDTNDSYLFWNEGNYVLSWGHRYPAEVLTNYNGKAISEISFFSMYPGAFDIVIYQETENNHPVEEIARKPITTARIGWSRTSFLNPVIVDSSKDLWIFVSNTDYNVHIVYNNYVTGNTEGCYYTTHDPTQICAHDSSNGIVWPICAYLTDGTYTYNLYDGTTKVNGDVPISGTSYTLTEPLSEGVHQFTVKTNYYGGESAASNKAGVTVGAPSLETLVLDTDDSMTLTEGSTLTVTGDITNADPANLIIEDGAQLIHPNCAVQATLNKNINAYSTETGVNDGWYTIASPIDAFSVDDLIQGEYDLYAYDEKEVYWRNQKVENNNITEFEEGKGLLYANANTISLAFPGSMKATNEQVTVTLRCQSSNENLKGFNLLGNPFTRNLGNGDITLNGEPLTTYYSVEGGAELVSHNINDDPIKPGQGFLVQAAADGQSLVFNPSSSKGRTDVNPSYISIEAGDDTFTDRAFVQFGEGNFLHKTTLGDHTAKLSVKYLNANYAAITIQETQGEIPVYFKATHDGTHTLNVNSDNVELNYLHLIDNLTGANIDLLTTPSYTFEAKTDDYESRFRLLFSPINNPNIDSYDIDGGVTQILDMTGRMVGTDRNQLTPGVYIVRTINGNETKSEKIVIK